VLRGFPFNDHARDSNGTLQGIGRESADVSPRPISCAATLGTMKVVREAHVLSSRHYCLILEWNAVGALFGKVS
jgi:hypothetical protein